jgi:hypothetical protein
MEAQTPPFLPCIEAMQVPSASPFMSYSTCSTRDFCHPLFLHYCDIIKADPVFHRKQWEWVFIMHHAHRMGAVAPGKRGLAFGAGTEPLPAGFAKAGMFVTATDAPPEIGAAWTNGQFANGLAALPRLDMDGADFERQVSFHVCDMNNIDPKLTGFDLCWSACALEHLGSLRHGADFIINSIKTLKPGGVAIHTTEFNLSSNSKTLETGPCVLYRRRDFDALISELRGLGLEVDDFTVAPDSTVIDSFVDVPPYVHRPHLKLALGGFVTTSAGIAVRRPT